MQQSIELDEYAGRPYHLAIRGEPTLEDPDDYAVTVYYNDPETRKEVEVARIDNSHGGSHLDRLFLENPDKEWIDVSLWEAVEHLIKHHPEYARKYRENHDS